MRLPVSEALASQLWPTIQLALSAGALAILLSIAISLCTAGRSPRLRKVASLFELVCTSTPVFWIGILLLMLFSFQLRLFPVAGANGWRSLVLPAVTLALPTVGLLSQVLRESMEKVLEQLFITTVRSRGQDVPVVLAVVLLAAAIYVSISTLLDIAYLFIDPRLRTQ